MANYLRVSMQETIRTLHEKGWSNRRIARELQINRRTVTRYVSKRGSKCTISTAGLRVDSEGFAESKCTISTAGSIGDSNADGNVQPDNMVEATCTISTAGSIGDLTAGSNVQPDNMAEAKCTISTAGSAGRKSLCEDYRDFIAARLEERLSAQRIYQDLLLEQGFTGSYESVKRYVRKLDDTDELPFRRLEQLPGVEVQVDYGTGGWIYDRQGKRQKTHLFRMVLSYSRKGYSEVSYTQSTESFIRALENAFRRFGGVPETVVIDNLKAGVLRPCFYDPELNPKLRDFADHYGTCILPTRVATPRHKGKVESAVKYAQDNALKGRRFGSLAEQNDYLRQWEERIADTRIHGTVKRQVSRMFEEEKPHLHSLPEMLFPAFEECRRKVHRDGHVEVKGAYYSTPAEYVRKEVWVRYDLRTVRIFNHRMEEIALHARAEPGHFSTHSYHIPAEKIANPERGNRWLLQQADALGGASGAWSRAMLQNRGIEGVRVLNGLLQLAGKYPASSINKACQRALELGLFRLRDLRSFVEENFQAEQQQFSFLAEHPLIRQMNEYGNLTQTQEVFYA